jgi:N utilization substance protein B
MSRRHRARQVALQVLYQNDLNPPAEPSAGAALLRQRLRSPELVAFAEGLVAGVRSHQAKLDGLIASAAAHWSLHRMAVTDRNVLRLGAYELLYTDTPPPVAIDEAVELAKRYGTAQSSQFVNGILDRLLHEHVRCEAPAAQPGISNPNP